MPDAGPGERRLTVPVSDRDHARGGPATSPVTIVTYGDYECPYTRKAEHVLAGIAAEHADQVRFVYRHFPMNKIHPHAQEAAEAAEAAGAQGDFWGMHDLLFANQGRLERDRLLEYAGDLGLDADRVRRDLDGGAHTHRIREDTRGGIGSGVSGTPNIFINGALRPERFHIDELPTEIDVILSRGGQRRGP